MRAFGAEAGAVTSSSLRHPRAIVLDLFNTLVRWDPERLPTMEIRGRDRRTTFPLLLERVRELTDREMPIEPLIDAYESVVHEISEERRRTGREISCVERFNRILGRLELDEHEIPLAEELARVHMAAIRRATAAPAEHREAVVDLSARVRLGLLSNFDDASTGSLIVEDTGVANRFEIVVISDAVGLRKPNPAIFDHVLAALDLPASDAWFVGDSPDEDVVGARAIGMPVVWIRGEQGPFPEGLPTPDAEIPSLASLPRLLAEIRP